MKKVIVTKTDVLLETCYPGILEFCTLIGIPEAAKTFGENNIKAACLQRVFESWAKYITEKERTTMNESDTCTCENPIADGEEVSEEGEMVRIICSLCGKPIEEDYQLDAPDELEVI